MPRYVVIHPIEHDGKRVEFGTIDLTEKQAAPLLAIGHIAQPKARAARSQADAPPVVQTPVPPPALTSLTSSSPTSPEGEGDEGDGDGTGDDDSGDDSTGAGAD